MKICHIGNFSSGRCGVQHFAEQTSIALRRAGCERRSRLDPCGSANDPNMGGGPAVKVLITGGGDYLGTVLIRRLLQFEGGLRRTVEWMKQEGEE